MARTRKDPNISKEMSYRLRYLINECIDASVEECSSILGYANSSPLRKAMAGHCFVDTERLILLSSIKSAEGFYANLHWLLTGLGQPLLKDSKVQGSNADLKKLMSLPQNKLKAIIELLDL
ncbi:hypothetical protein [Pseudoalteromonas sp. B62]|uniref:hypothetical protein n=1 Tax=Pseudoalteromonas sp. B62 TaxID=630483 RepID=UPI00301C8229